MKCLLPGGAHRAKLGVRPPSHGLAQARRPREHEWCIFFKLLICSLLALQGISYADLKASDYASSKVTHWLSRAESALAGGQLIAPPGDNALVYLERIFAKDPASAKAAEVLNQLIARFVASNDAAHAPHELERMRILKAVRQLARKYLRPELVELKDCHVSLGLASLQLGDPAEAGRQQQAAADLVAQHQLKGEGLSYLSQLLEQARTQRTAYDNTAPESREKAPRISQEEAPQTPSPQPSHRVFGTF